MYFMLHWLLLALYEPSKTKFCYSQWLSLDAWVPQITYVTNLKQNGRDALKKILFQPCSGLVNPSKMAFKGKHSLLLWFFFFFGLDGCF
jgi:hypothetical protein